MPTSFGQVCRMYDGKEVAIGAGGISSAECARLQGSVVDGGQEQQRVSNVLFKENLVGPPWGVAIDGTGLTQQADFGATLLSFPMCEMHRRFGRSELVRSLDHLDSKYSAQLLSLLGDPELRQRVFE